MAELKFDSECANRAIADRGARVLPVLGSDMPPGISRLVGGTFVSGADSCVGPVHEWGAWFGATLDGGLIRDCAGCGAVQGGRTWNAPPPGDRWVWWAERLKASR